MDLVHHFDLLKFMIEKVFCFIKDLSCIGQAFTEMGSCVFDLEGLSRTEYGSNIEHIILSLYICFWMSIICMVMVTVSGPHKRTSEKNSQFMFMRTKLCKAHNFIISSQKV